MNSTNNNGNEPPPSEDEDRSLLFGPPKEGTEPAGDRQKPRRAGASASSPPSRTSPPAAEAVAEPSDPAGRAGPAASSDAVQRRLLALLESLEKKIASPAAGETDLAEAARTIAEATEWANNIKAAMATLLETAGQLIEGQKSGRQDLDTAVAGLKSREDALAAQLKTFGTGMEKLGALLQRLDLRSSELEALKLKLVDYYGRWTDASKTIVEETSTLSKRLDAGDHMVTRLEGLQKGWTEQTATAITENAAAQLAAAEKTAGNVTQLATTGTEFLKAFATARGAALKEARQEWTRIRRWTVPALAIALVLAAPLFVFAGALGQSEFGVFDPYDDTGGWKEAVWKRYGTPIQDCARDSMRTGQVIECRINVKYP